MAMSTTEVCPNNYFCYQCSANIHPLMPDFTCPLCHGGFVEDMATNGINPDVQRPSILEEDILSVGTNAVQRSGQALADNSNIAIHGLIDSVLSVLRSDTFHVRERHHTRRTVRHQLYDEHERLLENFENLDDLITRLVSRLAVAGPQPASEDQLKTLSVDTFSPQYHYEISQCCICLERHDIGDMMTTLPCSHFFHNLCIIQWLRQCGTCPVCRKSLPAAEDSVSDADATVDIGHGIESTVRSASVENFVQEIGVAEVNADVMTDTAEIPTLSVIDDVEFYEQETHF